MRALGLFIALLLASPETAEASGRLLARPVAAAESGERGRLRLPDEVAPVHAYVPASYRPGAPLLMILHGAGGGAEAAIGGFIDEAEARGMIVVAPQSTDRTWDIVAGATRGRNGGWTLGAFGPDARRIDAALTELFARYRIDGSRLAIAGFSDGATYALNLGAANGDLFSHVIAFSPGFGPSEAGGGRPRVFVSHGTRDPVLAYAVTRRAIVPALRAQKLDVTFRRFAGGHGVPPDIRRAAVAWFLGARGEGADGRR